MDQLTYSFQLVLHCWHNKDCAIYCQVKGMVLLKDLFIDKNILVLKPTSYVKSILHSNRKLILIIVFDKLTHLTF